ncbi:hypothetical protein F511_36422 [Dorcoceras hygrometricum]|uniref:Uncharacterized protein n=1 Tax=Dorcoceras hygrometricum TaxID=472368 RepID=A0A2Z7CZE2_9LAMI|nr:hypothetical protein F511_36422 [Dorcoceras hygrometricum]
MSNTEHIQRCKAYTAASIITHAQSKAVKQAHIRTSSLLSYNYHKAVPSNTDLTPAKPNTDTSSGTLAQILWIGSYELNQICPTLVTQQKTLNEAQDYRREMSRDLTKLHASFQKLYYPKRLSKRSPVLQLLLQSELSTIGNRRRQDISTSWLVISWEWSKAGASKQLEEQKRTGQAQLQTKRGADTEIAPEDQLEDENKEAGEEKERALQELMKQSA